MNLKVVCGYTPVRLRSETQTMARCYMYRRCGLEHERAEVSLSVYRLPEFSPSSPTNLAYHSSCWKMPPPVAASMRMAEENPSMAHRPF